MPKFAPQGFVHAYVKFLDPESWTTSPSANEGAIRQVALRGGDGKMTSSELAVIVVTADKDAFPIVSHWISSLIAKPPPINTSDSSETASILSTASKVRKSTNKSRSTSKTLKSPHAHDEGVARG